VAGQLASGGVARAVRQGEKLANLKGKALKRKEMKSGESWTKEDSRKCRCLAGPEPYWFKAEARAVPQASQSTKQWHVVASSCLGWHTGHINETS